MLGCRLGTAWRRAVAEGRETTGHEWVPTEVPCADCPGGWHRAVKCVNTECPCACDGAAVGPHAGRETSRNVPVMCQATLARQPINVRCQREQHSASTRHEATWKGDRYVW